LKGGEPSGYTGSHEVRTQLRHLRSIGLIRTSKYVAEIAKDGAPVDLAGVELTPLGEQWVKHIIAIETIKEV